MRRVISLFAALLVLGLLCAVPFTAAAETANAYVAFSQNSAVVGDTVVITASFTASSIGAVQATVTYDPAVMEFVSGGNAAGGNGTVRLVGYGDGATGSLKFPLTFKAIGAGRCMFTVNTQDMIDWNEKDLGKPSAGAAMTVTAKTAPTTTATTARPTTTTTTARPTTTTTKRPTTTTARPTATGTTATTVTPPEDAVTLTVGGVTYTVATPDKAAIPVGFAKGSVQFGNQSLTAYTNENSAVALLYLTAEAETAWYIADTAADAVYPYSPLTVGEVTYLLLAADTPDGLTPATVTVEEEAFSVFAFLQETRADFKVFKAMNAEGSIGWYCWDTVENTVQRYVPLTATSTAPIVTTTTTTTKPTTTTTKQAAAGNTLAKTALGVAPWIIAAALLLVCIALAILAVIFYRRALPPPSSHHTPRH